jgi:excinuclease ABC subunit C
VDQVANEVEAILLEYALIKRHRPRFNIRLVDDKSYPYLAVTLPDQWPRAAVVRGRKRPGIRYFGPYAHAGAIRDTLDLLLRSFPVRTCSDAKLERHAKLGRPCLLYHIERCSGPCIQAVDHVRYDRMVEDLMDFLAGDTDEVEGRLESEMEQAAEALDFERAARLRDRLGVLRLACERQQMVTERPEDLDVLGLEQDPLEAAVCVFHVRRGRVVGRRAFVVDKVEELSTAMLVGRILEELYAGQDGAGAPGDQGALGVGRRVTPGRRRPVDPAGWTSGSGDPAVLAADRPAETGLPRTVLVPELPDDAEAWEELLTTRRGRSVALRVPLRGGKRHLMDTVTRNAGEELTRHRLRRASDHNARARALESLREALGLAQAPLRIECYDMSHLQGTDYVGSMVVLEDGLPRKSEYRRFRIRDVPGNDDYAAMEEVLTRRLTALLESRAAGPGEAGARSRRFSYPPQLLLLDGGKGQLGVGVRVLEQLGLAGDIPVADLAKTFEEVYVPGRPDPLRIPRGSDGLFLLQRIRDEAHRFAISYHRTLRGRRMTESALAGVPGLGQARRARLLRELGSVSAVRAASLTELEALPWLPDAVGRALHSRLHALPPRRALKAVTATGPAGGEDGGR